MGGSEASDRDTARLTLRDRTRRAVKAEVARVAFGLFLAQGFEQTTVEQILDATGISKSSFFRYFPTKEDIVMGSFADSAQMIGQALEGRPPDEELWQALRHAMQPIVTATLADPDGSRAITRILQQAPSLQGRQYEKSLYWQSLLMPEVARRMGLTDQADPRPGAVVAAALGCLNAATRAWAAGEADDDLETLLDLAMSAMRPV